MCELVVSVEVIDDGVASMAVDLVQEAAKMAIKPPEACKRVVFLGEDIAYDAIPIFNPLRIGL